LLGLGRTARWLTGSFSKKEEDMSIFSPAAWVLKLCLVAVLPSGLVMAASDKSGTAKSDSRKNGKLSSADERFVKDAAAGGMMEVELGKMAAEKAASDKVKEFGRRMQDDHGKANNELKSLAANKGVDLPKTLEGKHKKTIDRLSKLSGEEFDRQYMRAMIDDHKQDLQKFEREADKGKDGEIKQFASKHVPILKKHLELARTTGEEVKATSKTPVKDSARSKESRDKSKERGSPK
jgi:putative membrane protein